MNDLANAAAIKEIRQDDIVIAFVGPEGSGKTHLIDLLANRQKIQHKNLLGLFGRPAKVNGDVHHTRIKHETYGDRIILLDTPGFENGPSGSVAFLEVQQKIRSWLQKHYENATLTGIVYLQQVASQHPPNRVEAMYKDLCGGGSMSRITLLTTMWHGLAPKACEDHHEKIRLAWSSLTHSDSPVHSFRGDQKCTPQEHEALQQTAWDLILSLVKEQDEYDSSLLKKELEDLEKELCGTEEGRILCASLKEVLSARLEVQRKLSLMEHRAHILDILKKELKKTDDAKRYLNRFGGGSEDHSTILGKLLSWMGGQ